jgi:uncharacterized membrane protein (UPF0182 family)
MTSEVPDWVEALKKGDFLVIVFPYTGETVFAEVIENGPAEDPHIYFGTITINYTIKNFTRQVDLLYDDYSKDGNNYDSWYAYRVT